MAVSTPRFLVAAALCVLAPWAMAQGPVDAAPVAGPAPLPQPAASAFTLQIDGPDEVRQLLEKHLELQRYRVLVDLSDSEIQTLMLGAEDDARQLLSTLGYFSPQISLRLNASTVPPGRHIVMAVQPGPETRVRSAQVLLQGPIADEAASPAGGAARQQRQAVQDGWLLPEHERFTQTAWDEAKQQALKQLLAKRYAAARIADSLADVDADAAQAALQVTLDSGPAYRFGGMVVEGSSRYSEALVRNFARITPGDDYSVSQLSDAQKRLTDSGYFDAAYLGLDLESPPEAAVVRAQVKEAAMQKLVLGVGASTDTGARWSVEHTHNQVPGIGWRAVNKLSADRDTRTFSSDWTSQPGSSQWRWAASALLGQVTVGEIEVDTQRYRFGRFTTQAELDQSYYLQFERTGVLFRETREAAANEAATVNYAFALRRFDSVPFPSRGWGVGGELGVGSILGADQAPYARALLNARLYQPLESEGASLFNRQRSGRMLYRAQVGAVLVDNAADVPFNQLFLTGGDTTVRGYRRDEIGVTRAGVLTAESGRYMANASVEWQRPIVRGGVMTEWEGALFLDTGAVANRTEEMSFKVGVGVGARWKSPIGPLQLDLAYGVATEQFRLHLNVGFVF